MKSKHSFDLGEFDIGDSGEVKRFRASIRKLHQSNRRSFPWRERPTPYSVFVSEVMLQQTQAERVLEKYRVFVRAYPNFRRLAGSEQQELLKAWVGLGYNRRALALRSAALCIVSNHRGRLPRDEELLQTLPGIGSYSAAAIRAFAYDLPAIVLETNIRTVLVHSFLRKRTLVADNELLDILQLILPRAGFREWYYALMDYGWLLKRSGVKLNTTRPGYRRQSAFEGSVRQLRGRVLKVLASSGPIERGVLCQAIENGAGHCMVSVLESLMREGFIEERNRIIRISR